MDRNNLELTDLLELRDLQELQNYFSQLTGFTAVLVNPDGHPLTKTSNLPDYFAALMDTRDGKRVRLTSCRELCRQNRKTHDAVISHVPETGMYTAAVPIFLGEEHLASWIVGQAALESVDLDKLRILARELGADPDRTGAGAADIRVVPRSQFDNAVSFFRSLSETLIQLATVNYNMMESNQHLMELTEQLDSTAQMLTKFTNSADVGMYVADFFTGELLQANDRAARYLDIPMGQMLGRPCWTCFNPDLDSFCPDCPHDRLLDATGHPGKPVVWERYLPDRDMWTQFTNQAIYWVDGRLAQMVTYTDITQTKNMQEQLARLAYYDRTMKLPNNLKLLSQLDHREITEPFCLICFDIISLRNINDVYGRHLGDELLESIARWTQRLQIPGSTLYRMDGDEFLLLIRNYQRSQSHAIADKLISRFEEPWIFDLSGEKIHIFCGVSLGVVFVDDPGEVSGEELLNLTERTLTSARKQGKPAIYDEKMDQEYQENLRLEMSLRKCIKEGMFGFDVYYQPIVDPSTGKWCSLEALCRWNSPECGTVAPLIFIREAEQTGLIGILGRWVLETAVRQCKEWGLDRLENFILDVNLSPSQMTDETLVTTVIEILDRYDYPGEKLSLEITESTEMNFTNHTLMAIERLRRAGVQVALDDFGTGYSSFNNLKQLPVSILKTERAFLSNIDSDTYLQYLFYVMVELAHAADMKIIAEGVESEEQMRILLNNGVDFLQGYLFSPPLPAQVLTQKLDSFHRVSDTFRKMRYEPIDTTEVSMLSGIPAINRLLSSCMEDLLSIPDIDQAVNQVLRRVGEKFSVCRAFVYWNDGKDCFTNTHEWCAKGVPSVLEAIQHQHLPVLVEQFSSVREQGILLINDIQQLSPEKRAVFATSSAKALAAAPIWSGGNLQGVVGYEDLGSTRDWMPEEIAMLYNLALMTAGMLDKRAKHNALRRRLGALERVLDNLNISVYVSGMGDHEVIFANDTAARRVGDPVGRKCWELLQDRDTPCKSCKVEWLRHNPGANQCKWEYYDQKSGRHLEIHDSIIPWEGDQEAHLEYALDVTTLREYEAQLEALASMDAFTRTLSRSAFLARAEELVDQMLAREERGVLCVVDVDGLKGVNDHHGHAKGDELLLSTAAVLREMMGDGDLIGRYGGDEFVLLLPGHTVTEAEARLDQCLHRLSLISETPGLTFSFSYGLAEVSELPGSTGGTHRLLELADKRMLALRQDKKKRPEAHAEN